MDAPVPPALPFTKTVMVVAAALYDADGRILIQEFMKPSFPGHWEFPGGKVEDGELPEDALVRELREELGVITCVNCLQPLSFVSHVYGELQAHVILLLYAVRQWQGPALGATHGHDGQKLAWVKPADLYQWKMLPADVPLIAALQN